MLETKHSKGPWQWGRYDGRIDIATMEGDIIAGVRQYNHATQRLPAEDNARLIAAAPDLLAACRQAMAALLSYRKRYGKDGLTAGIVDTEVKLMEAVNKAEGRQ